ncbi:MAG TPA: hypothetical protein VFW07_05335 [Parafilimonas sp.]|nr:hypothetical protein [Parafilimonas sp.]
MKLKLLFLAAAIITCMHFAQAQTDSTAKPDFIQPVTAANMYDTIQPNLQAHGYLKNNIQWNATAILFKSYNFSYERSITRKISVVASYRFMPSTKVGAIPVGKKIFDKISDEENDNVDIKESVVSNQAFTAEVRFYGGKHPGARGFYFSVYGRYGNFTTDYPYEYEDETGSMYSIPLQVKANGFCGGIGIGAQWLIAKRVTLNWYILGAQYGGLNGTINGVADLSSMSAEDQQNLQEEINELIGVNSKQYIDATVSDNGVTGTVKGPFLGLRGGISIGIAF